MGRIWGRIFAVVFALGIAACTSGEQTDSGSQAARKTEGPYNCFTDAPQDAPVTIAVFTSPTRAATDGHPAETVRDAAKDFPGKVRCELVPVSPFEQKDALQAGKAILAAGEQGRAWDMYVHLKKHAGDLSETFYVTAARELGLDTAKFEQDMKRDALTDQVKKNTQKTSQGHPLRRVQLDGQWAPCGSPSLDCLADKIREKLASAG